MTNPLSSIRFVLLLVTFYLTGQQLQAQVTPVDTAVVIKDSLPKTADSILRIKNLNPYFTLHVDSTLKYQLEINKSSNNYFYYLRNSPVGLSVSKESGLLSFKAEKSFFLSGKLKYDFEYKVQIGVQNLDDPKEKVDTFFTILFYNTEIIPSRLKPTINSVLTIEETDTVNFKVLCENGNFPIERISFFSNIPLKNFTMVRQCEDEFTWSPSFDFVKESDSGRMKIVQLNFVGANRFMIKDTAVVKIIVKDALNYPFALQEYNLVQHNISNYVLQLKYTFVQLDQNVKKTKSTRTGFDITSSATALTGSILSSSASADTKKTGQIMPSIGVSLVPIKEAVAPQKVFDQNQAALIRTSIKRLEYMQNEYGLVGEKDPDILKKTIKLKEELKQSQIQLIDIPLELANALSEEELNAYFNSPKVTKKYRLKK